MLEPTIKRGGVLIIPAFAVGRAQSILYYLHLLHRAGRIPNVPIYLHSPMAVVYRAPAVQTSAFEPIYSRRIATSL